MTSNKITFTDEQRAWLVEHYADTSNADCLAALGMKPCQYRTLRRLAKSLGLKKSDQYIKQCQRNTWQAAAAANRITGNNGKANLIHGKPYRFKKGNCMREIMGDERWKDMLRRRGETLKKTYQKERRRVLFGLDQHTHLTAKCDTAYLYNLRYIMRKKGYIVDRGSRVAIVTSETKRSASVERRAKKNYFTIKEQ